MFPIENGDVIPASHVDRLPEATYIYHQNDPPIRHMVFPTRHPSRFDLDLSEFTHIYLASLTWGAPLMKRLAKKILMEVKSNNGGKPQPSRKLTGSDLKTPPWKRRFL